MGGASACRRLVCLGAEGLVVDRGGRHAPGLVATRQVTDILETVLGQDTVGQVATQANRTGDDDGFLLGQLVEMLAELVYRDVDEPGDRTQLVFRLGTDVDTDRVVGQVGDLSPADDSRFARQDILGNETGHVYRILGGRVGGRIGVLQFGQVVNGVLPLDCLGQHLDSFVYPFEADNLRAKQTTVVGREEDFYGEGRRAGIVSGM